MLLQTFIFDIAFDFLNILVPDLVVTAVQCSGTKPDISRKHSNLLRCIYLCTCNQQDTFSAVSIRITDVRVITQEKHCLILITHEIARQSRKQVTFTRPLLLKARV